MAFRSNFRTNIISQNLPVSATESLARNRITTMPSCSSTARFMSSSQEEYSSMTVSQLREILRARGLAVSGIKSQLVERLASGGGTVVKPKEVTYAEDEVEDDLSGLLDQLKTPEAGDVSTSGKQLGKMPGNLSYAKEGEDDDEDDDDEWYDDEDDDESDPNKTVAPAQRMPTKRTNTSADTGTKRFSQRADNDNRPDAVTFKEDFQGTRVFVQGLPEEASWKELKDHFKILGEVVFASVSVDKRTGRSKQCGIVQFETPETARKAIREMRNHPMNGAKLYVREDVQESQKRAGGREGKESKNDDYEYDDRSARRNSPPDVWKRANDKEEDGGGDSWYNLKDDELKEIEALIEKRDKQRIQRNFRMSDQLRAQLGEEFGVHLDDTLKMWWTDTKHGGVPGAVSEIKGEGKWGKTKAWRQIPTNKENDAMVDTARVMELLSKRDRARKRKDFDTADDLLKKAHDSPQGSLGLRIHDESRTWRIWTEAPPPMKKGDTPDGYEKLSAQEMCIQIVTENEPDKVDEVREMLRKFPGREWNIFKRLKGRYNVSF